MALSGNSAASGGGISNSGLLGTARVALTNSTVVRNSATQDGGGIFQTTDESVLGLINTLKAARWSRASTSSGTSGVTNTDGNLVGNVSPNSSPIDPGIGPLADNGGPTKTHALLAGSPAIDAASAADCLATDQRGVTRPQGAGCDIGSYERK